MRESDGRAIDLTPGEKLKAMWYGFADDDRSFFIATNERDPKFFDLFRYRDLGGDTGKDAERYPRDLVFKNDQGFRIAAVSPNGKSVALEKLDTRRNNDLYVLALDGKKPPKLVTSHKGEVLHHALAFAPGGRSLYYTSDAESEWQRLYVVELDSDRHRVVLDVPADVSSVEFSKNGRYRVVSVNDDARTRITVTDLRSNQDVEMPETIEGDVVDVAFSRSASLMALSVASDTTPVDVHVVDFSTKKTVRLTRALPPELNPESLVLSTPVRYERFDGERIPALLYKPLVASRERKVPVVVWLHGGPGGQCRIGWQADLQALCNQGFGVLAVNNRGSSGYGKTFYARDDKNHGDGDLKDVVWARKYLAELDWVDAKKVAVLGGSYGGYLVAAAMAFHPEAFDAGINLFGVTNWVRTLESIPPWWEAQRKALYDELGDPKKDAARLKAISPLFAADRIKRPLLVVQGKNDPRVLEAESEELVNAAKKGGAEVEYLLFPDEGHGFRKKENRIRALESILAFLKKHLGPK